MSAVGFREGSKASNVFVLAVPIQGYCRLNTSWSPFSELPAQGW
jgi:hypothetical protein